MATETETFSMPTTAPTEIAGDHRQHRNGGGPSWANDEWDTTITPSMHQIPTTTTRHAAYGSDTAMNCSQQDDGSDTMSDPGKSVEESCKRALDHFPCPSVAFPMPTLEFDFRIAVALNPEPSRIENRVQKEITTIKGGRWSGSFGNGRVMAGGYDLGQARGFRPIRIVEGAFVLQTTDQPPAMLEMRTRGSLSGPCDVLDTLLNARESKENIDPRQYGFRTFATVKTADKRYAEFVNCGLWVASGVWRGEELIIDAYRLT
ncbi:hypothetical protein PT974_09571 [Cladobotryum mycophilum]|uniref:Uncharacterized protein n=1 Tax=Cladobotryum mycophilum TaxID=491253 RepID=A0ABR0SHH8_9HYPO